MMIALLSGVVAHLVPGEVVLDVAGVGYRVRVPTGLRLPGDGDPGVANRGLGGPGVGNKVVLHTHLVVREDALDLYGFLLAADRDLFRVMLGVAGIGPKIALAAIDTLGSSGLRSAVVTDDVTALTAIPGVGRKGAQRLVLELRGKLGSLPGTDDAMIVASVDADGTDPRGGARMALAALGYGAGEIEQALRGMPTDVSAEELIRLALRGLLT
ncbi:MAG: Holliday junction branch migration protein RuvA [Euzebya sp.]